MPSHSKHAPVRAVNSNSKLKISPTLHARIHRVVRETLYSSGRLYRCIRRHIKLLSSDHLLIASSYLQPSSDARFCRARSSGQANNARVYLHISSNIGPLILRYIVSPARASLVCCNLAHGRKPIKPSSLCGVRSKNVNLNMSSLDLDWGSWQIFVSSYRELYSEGFKWTCSRYGQTLYEQRIYLTKTFHYYSGVVFNLINTQLKKHS